MTNVTFPKKSRYQVTAPIPGRNWSASEEEHMGHPSVEVYAVPVQA